MNNENHTVMKKTKLCIEKFTVAKLDNPHYIWGGSEGLLDKNDGGTQTNIDKIKSSIKCLLDKPKEQ